MAVAKFFASAAGRWLRGAVGVILGVIGLAEGPIWWLVAVGVLFVVVAAANVCLLAVPFGGPFNGRRAKNA